MDLTFANPTAFWLLLGIPVFIVLKVLGDARARKSVTRLASPRLLEGLLYSTGRSRSWVVLSLELLAFALFAAALARPQYGIVSEESKGSGRSLIIAMDTSRSMLATDVKPSRLDRAQMAAEDLVKRLRHDRIGLMPFAGTAFMYAPITPDTDAVMESIQAIDTDIIPTGGSNLARAIDLAIATFKKADLSGQQAMVIFSDGEELEGEALAAAKRARDANLAIICVGVGLPNPEPIPDPAQPGDFLRDKRNNNKIITTRLKKEVLTQIAALTNGLYLNLDGAGISDSRIDLILSKLQRSAMKSKTLETAVDRYRWPLCAGLISLTAAFLTGIVRRHRGALPATGTAALAALTIAFFTIPSAVHAQDDPLPPPDTAAKEAKPAPAVEEARAGDKPEPESITGDPWKFYKEGDWRNSVFNFSRVAAKARDEELDRLQMARGVAAYKAALAKSEKFDSGMMEHSMDAFGIALSSDDHTIRSKAHYNLANAIFERARAAEKQRLINLSKAKTKKKAKKFKVTLKYIDTVIRQCENSVEHYQETLILDPDNKDAQKNHEEVKKFIEILRDIRLQKASEQQGEGEGEGEGEDEGESDGKAKGKGKGKGKGNGEGEDEGDGEDEGEGEGDSDKDGKDPGEGSGDKGNEEVKGKVGADGDADGDGGGKEEGEDKGAGDKEGADGDEKEGDGEGGSEFGRNSAIQTLKNLSQELKTRPRNPTAREHRPAKDW